MLKKENKLKRNTEIPKNNKLFLLGCFKITQIKQKADGGENFKTRTIISKKNLKTSTQRNKLKRRINYFFTTNKDKVEADIFIVNLIKKTNKAPNYKEIKDTLKTLLNKQN